MTDDHDPNHQYPCDHYHELTSAQIDGETSAADDSALATHVAVCADCQEHQRSAWELKRRMSFDISARTPRPSRAKDTRTRVLGLARGPRPVWIPNTTAHNVLRWVLFVFGATLLVINLIALAQANGSPEGHLTRHGAVFGTALGVAILVVVARPERAIGLVPLTSTLSILMLIVGAGDLVAGRATIQAEAVHLIEFCSLLCLWTMSGALSRFSSARNTVHLVN